MIKIAPMVKRITSNQMEGTCQLTSRFLCLFVLLTENKGNWHSVDDRQTQMFKYMWRYCCLFGCGPRWGNLICPCENGGQMIIGRMCGKMRSKVCLIIIIITWRGTVKMSPRTQRHNLRLASTAALNKRWWMYCRGCLAKHSLHAWCALLQTERAGESVPLFRETRVCRAFARWRLSLKESRRITQGCTDKWI